MGRRVVCVWVFTLSPQINILCPARSWFNPAAMESTLRDHDPQAEGTARQTLAISAVARVDQLRLGGDLVADFAALAAAGLRKFHGNISRRLAFR
jgi:hypothetical protein